MIERVAGVSVVHWNPRRNSLPYPVNRLPIGSRVNNFGDLLGPLIVSRLVERVIGRDALSNRRSRLVTVGSILGLARDSDVVWGTGVNGKMSAESHTFSTLDVRAVRGPKTRSFLLKRGIAVPETFGDPALLVPALFPEWAPPVVEKKRRIGVVPNFNDLSLYRGHPGLISPIGRPDEIVRELISCESVVASSLHGIVLAEAYGIPTAPLASRTEPRFKYDDYFEGTGRPDMRVFEDLETAERALARGLASSLRSSWVEEPLLRSFPADLWRAPELKQ